jgi:hypothetical protein
LPGWELLTENEKDRFRDMIKNSHSEIDWQKVIDEAKKFIKSKNNNEEEGDEGDSGGDDSEDHKDLQSEIQEAIQEI